METITLEIRASEGGDDSKLLVEDLANIYIKICRNNNFTYNVSRKNGIITI